MKTLQVIDQDTNQSFTFHDNAGGVILREFEGFEYPAVRSVVEDVANRGGGVYITSKFGRRSLSWKGDLLGSNVFALRREMLSVMRQRGTMKLLKFTTYDDLDLQCEAEIVKVLNPYTHQIHTYLIEAVAPDWRFYSQTLHTNTDDAAEQTITNAGTEETEPVFRLYGAFTEVVVTNLTTSESFTITQTVAGGDYVEINVNDKTVKLDDGTSIYSAITGEFFTLVPGDNVLTFTPTGGDASTELYVEWRDAYNGI